MESENRRIVATSAGKTRPPHNTPS